MMWGLFQIPYDRMVVFHKMLGRFAFGGFVVHGICMLCTMQAHGRRFDDKIDLFKTNILFGLLGLIFAFLLVATSIPWMRRKQFENFYFNHMQWK